MSSSSQSSSMSTSNSQASCLDPLDSLIDFSEYETVSYQSPSISPSTMKSQFSRPVSNTPTTLPSNTQQSLSGPSHNYSLFRQQTGIPQGALASTLAINSSNSHISQYGFSNDYLSDLSPNDDFVDFNTPPRPTPTFSQSEMDMDIKFESSNDPAFFFPDNSVTSSEFVDPSSLGGSSNTLPITPVLPTQSSNVGRLWPGMHQQQAAIAKAQAQQKQQQQIIQQQRQNVAMGPQQRQTQRSKAHQPTDPIVEEKISQLLNSMRQSSVNSADMDDAQTPTGQQHQSRLKKDEEEMDEDERLLASEEGKKLSSKERRQLRNKVSARAFRSRRKEYISQLEGEIAAKVNENHDLRIQNRALLEENTRLSDLTRMLLSSPSFSGFLDTLTQNPTAAQQQQPQQQAPTPAPQQQRQQVENRQLPKDINPYAAAQQMQQQQIGMAIIPEQAMDFSSLDLNGDGAYGYEPQVFSVLSMPETVIDSDVLSGKASDCSHSLSSDDEKVELPTVERMPASTQTEEPKATTPVIDEEFDADPAFALFADSTPSVKSPAAPLDLDAIQLFNGIQPEKALSRIELVVIDSDAEEAEAEVAMAKVLRLCDSLDSVATRLENLTRDF